MTNKNINIKANVIQIMEGIEYRGTLGLDECNFEYQLKFGVPINRLDELARTKPNNLMDQISLDVTDSKGESILLDNKTKLILMSIVGELSIDFYNNPQTEDSNMGFIGGMVKKQGPFENMGVKESLGMSTEYKLPRFPELEKLLEGDKI